MKNSIIPIFLPHLGCPNDCVFCNQRTIAAAAPPPPEEVRGIITAALSRAECPQIAFYGGSFTALETAEQERYLAAAHEFVRRGECDSIRVSTRPDCVDSQTVARLARFGVRTVELGAQSMDDAVLSASHRGHTAADTVRASKLILSAGMELILQMMTGLPGSSGEKDLATAHALAALAPTGARVYPTCVIRGSALEHMQQRGGYEPQTLEQAVDLCAQILEVFEAASIPVLRIGLNPTDELTHGGVVSGPYHPAFGELVRSRWLRNLTSRQLDALPPGGAQISVPRGRAPLMRGQKRCNMLYFEQNYPHLHVEVVEAEGQTLPVLVRARP